jgi:hypothetical protein
MKLDLPTDCLVVFVDETGDELLKDPVQKVFGLAGCAVMAADLDRVVREPWLEVRRIASVTFGVGGASARLRSG